MVTYIKSDLDFILKQIKIAEAHAAGTPLYGPGGLIPTYNLAWGLRTVNGEYNNLLHPEWGSADNPFPEPLGNDYRPAEGGDLDMDGPGGQPAIPTAPNYNPSNSANNIVVDGSVRTISNLLVDQTLDNPAAIMVALERAGATLPPNTTLLQLAVTIKNEYQVVKPFLEVAEGAHLDNVNAQRTLVSAQQAFDTDPTPANQTALDDATAAAAVTQAASDAADLALAGARVTLDTMLADNGITMDGDNISLPNIAPDEGLSASFNSWFTLFGQFFDHGLDLVGKGGSGTVFIPLQPDDPLYDPASPTNFMVLTRATVTAGPDNVMNTADDIRPINTTTPFVDQNQTYTSHASHQVFLREYVMVDGKPQATGNLLDGANGGLPTWGEVKAQAREMLGIDLTDYHVGNLPLLATDEYGNFIPNPTTGFPQVVMVGSPPTLASGTPAAPLNLVTIGPDGPDQGTLPDVTHLAVRTGHAFLDDIAHTAVPVGKIADGDIEVGLANPANGSSEYDNELLDAHYVTGDGRGNENIGLTTVHHVFHSEHNRLMDHTKDVILATNDIAFINEWLDVGITALTEIDTQIERDALKANAGRWDGERLFQAAKFGTEMQYQHLVFEEFARKIQPNINVFLVPDGYDVTIDPTILAEFAHVVYRFGHSMLTETIDRFDPTFTADHIGLIEGFLNPLEFASLPSEQMTGAVIRGMTRQVGNHIDEFVTSALRNNLLGLPLDLATINLARGRDTGVPSLNEARRQFYDATGNDAILKPYESWVEFASHLKHEASIINFIAAYGTHTLITDETTVEGKRDAAITLILGEAFGKFALMDPPFVMPADRDDFLNGTGAYGAAGALGGLENVDLWIGGLAEAITPFGGMLGSTFNFVFEAQMEKLQNGDRFYYLQRLDGLHLFGEMEGNSFAGMIMRNTDATHLPSDVFSTPGLILEVDRTKQYNPGLGETAGLDGIMEDDPLTLANEAADNMGIDPVGGGLLTQLVIRNNPATVGPDTNYLRYTGGDHVLLGGTDNADILIAGIGDDTLFGDGGNDNLEGGHGNDIINAGDGDDIIRDMGGDDNIKGGDGNDAIHAGPGLDLVMGGRGQDFVILGTDMGSEVFAGEGNDFIYGNKNAERILGNEGDDWIETGTFDGAPGDNFDEIFAHDGVDGNDVFLGDGGFDEFIGEGGDDIMVGSPGRGKMAGMSGFDWATYKDAVGGINADLSIGIVFDESPVLPPNTALDEFESMEGLSGSAGNDVLAGSNEDATTRLPLAQGGSTGYLGSALDAQGIALINGLQAVLGAGVNAFSAGDILLGGDGSDVITGRGGDDIIDGDKWLNVQIGVFAPGDVNHTGTPSRLVNSMKELTNEIFAGTINPGQLSVVRTIETANGAGDTDVAVFADVQAAYTITRNANGTISVAHTTITDGLESDGVDMLRNIEVLRFADGDLVLSPPSLQLHAFDANAFVETFPTESYTDDDGAWTQNWVEAGDNASATTGEIEIEGGRLSLDEDIDGGETLTRGVNLTGATTATISFDYEDVSLEGADGEHVVVEGWNGTTWLVLGTLGDAASGTGTFSAQLTPAMLLGTNSQIRFRAEGNWDNGDSFFIDNVRIDTRAPAAVPTINHATTFVEGGAAVSVANQPGITDADDTVLASARIVLTNAQLGDQLVAGTLPAGISANTIIAGGQITINLVGSASLADYQAAIQAVVFSNNSTTPAVVPRAVLVTVSDGLLESNVATTTINVTPVDSPVNAVNDTIITNAAPGSAFDIPEWVLLANDVDVDDIVDVTAVSAPNGVTASLNTGSVTVTDTGAPDGSFTYTATGGPATDNAVVTVDSVVATTTYSETFGGTSYTDDDGAWSDNWVETDDDANSTGANGQIRINNNQLQFDAGNNAGASNGAVLVRGLAGLAGATSASITYAYSETIDAGETVLVEFTRNGTDYVTVQMISSTSGSATLPAFALAGPFTAGAALRFTASTMNLDADLVTIDNISVAFTLPATTVNGGTGGDILVGDINGSTFDAGTGNDTVLAGNGNDLIVWNANTAAGGNNTNGDGRDFVDGGAGTDTFDVNGNGNSETYRLYTRVEALAAGLTGLNANTEIVVTRGPTTNNAAIIAELDNIEEITIDTFGGAGDTIQIFGDFSATSLALNTITIDGGEGDDTVDITSLGSAHRIVFRSNGGNDTIIGALRPQDVIELPPGTDYVETTVDGVTTLTSGDSSVTYTTTGEGPQVGEDDDDDDDDYEDDEDEDDHDDDDDDDDCDNDDDDDDDDAPAPSPSASGHLIGTPMDDVLLGTSGGDLVFGYAGTDFIVTGAGA
ncbi:MAG: peroxidase family protein, partial [Devosia sp.]